MRAGPRQYASLLPHPSATQGLGPGQLEPPPQTKKLRGRKRGTRKPAPKHSPLPPHNHTIPIPVNHPPTRKNAPIPLIQQHR